MKIKSITVLIAIMVISIGTMGGCTEKKKERNGIITLLKGDVLLNGNKTMIGKKIRKGDTVETRDKSYLSIQFSQDAVLAVKPSTKITLEELTVTSEGKPVQNFYQQNGSTFSKILTKGSGYAIRTRHTIAAVRGTSFALSVSEEGDNSGIKVLHGEVEFEATEKDTGKKEKKIIVAEKKSQARNGILQKPEPMKDEEMNVLREYDDLPVLTMETLEKIQSEENPRGVSIPPSLDQKFQNPGEVAPISMENENPKGTGSTEKAKPVTIDDLRKQYGSLTQVTDKNGRVYIGKYSMQGEYSVIITTMGTVRIPSKDIQSIKPY